MAKGNPGADDHAKVKVRVIEFELEGGNAIDICNLAGLFTSSNTKKILDMQLTRRNMAAHPSLVSIGAPQADDAISSLVTSVVLVLT